ncbi:MAG: hypothetical protein E6J70_10995 [Deltaproteobacteria bacterium]|nr:MAG: hypothetical protein E6J70_10995 [Deltaproteobacteria bacterium]
MGMLPRGMTLTRREVDLVARAVVSGRRGHGRRMDRLADLVASTMRNRLEAAGASGAGRIGHVRGILDRDVRDVLVGRVAKHLAWAALRRSGDAGAHAS